MARSKSKCILVDRSSPSLASLALRRNRNKQPCVITATIIISCSIVFLILIFFLYGLCLFRTSIGSSDDVAIITLGFGFSRVGLLPEMPHERPQRFPSIEERIKVYMSYWYLPPCNETFEISYRFLSGKSNQHTSKMNATVTVTKQATGKSSLKKSRHTLVLDGNPESGKVFFAMKSDFFGKKQFDGNDDFCRKRYVRPRLRNECHDLQTTIPASFFWDPANTVDGQFPPLLIRISDGTGPYHFPNFRNSRYSLTANELNSLTSQVPQCSKINERVSPIIWKTNTARHLEPIHLVTQADREWHQKKDQAIFRGALSGPRIAETINLNDHPVENCQRFPRCFLAWSYHNSTLVNAKLTKLARGFFQTNGVIGGMNVLTNDAMTMEQLLEYKILIFLDGNDVASGLNWGLLSRSVVMMPPPKYTTWAMEELLQPYVHYVPLYDNLSNVEEQVQWVLENDVKAQEIAHQSSLWIQDLVLHRNSHADDQEIYSQILNRYKKHFRRMSPDIILEL